MGRRIKSGGDAEGSGPPCPAAVTAPLVPPSFTAVRPLAPPLFGRRRALLVRKTWLHRGTSFSPTAGEGQSGGAPDLYSAVTRGRARSALIRGPMRRFRKSNVPR
jgi:hypothetical protein